MNEIEVYQDRSFNQLAPKEKMHQAGEIATILNDVIEKQKLFTMIQGRKYVNVEGWTTMGSLIHVLPRESKVTKFEDGSFEAYVELINGNGVVVGGGSALVGMDEKTWANRPEYARRSMAITRATGKAYRLAYSWVMSMADYEVTPLEEMPSELIDVKPKQEPLLYEATDDQKKTLAKYAKDFGIAQKEQLIELSGAMAKIPMVALKAEIKKYLETYVGGVES